MALIMSYNGTTQPILFTDLLKAHGAILTTVTTGALTAGTFALQSFSNGYGPLFNKYSLGKTVISMMLTEGFCFFIRPENEDYESGKKKKSSLDNHTYKKCLAIVGGYFLTHALYNYGGNSFFAHH